MTPRIEDRVMSPTEPAGPERTGAPVNLRPLGARLADERGIALIIALMATVLLTGLGMALVLLTNTETMITANYRDAQETMYAADAGVETAMQDLLLEADWNRVLGGAERSGFFDEAATTTLADGTRLDLEAVRAHLQKQTDDLDVWGANDPQWQWYARGRGANLLPGGDLVSDVYVAVYVADDPSETDGDPARDTNGVLSLRVEAYGRAGSRKVLEVTVARTDTTEIERGFIAQRGQEELNQRARKAAVQNPGRGLTEMKMSLASGGL
jgi:hypothetical protein